MKRLLIFLAFILMINGVYAPDAHIVTIVAPNDSGTYISPVLADYNIVWTYWYTAFGAPGHDTNVSIYVSVDQNDHDQTLRLDVNMDEYCDPNAEDGSGYMSYANPATCSYLWSGVSFLADANYLIDINALTYHITDETDVNIVQDVSDASFYLDQNASTTSWDANESWNNNDVNILLTCNDGGSCTSTNYRLDTDATTTVSYGDWTTYDANGILLQADGNYALDFNTTDEAGNIPDQNLFYVLIDQTTPTTSWDWNNAWYVDDINIHLTCNDATSGCNKHSLYRVDTNSANGISWGAWQAYDANGILFQTDGNWAIDFNSTDNAGNLGDQNLFYVLRGSTLPEVTILTPISGTYWGTGADMNVAFTIIDRDNPSEISLYIYFDTVPGGQTHYTEDPILLVAEEEYCDNTDFSELTQCNITLPTTTIMTAFGLSDGNYYTDLNFYDNDNADDANFTSENFMIDTVGPLISDGNYSVDLNAVSDFDMFFKLDDNIHFLAIPNDSNALASGSFITDINISLSGSATNPNQSLCSQLWGDLYLGTAIASDQNGGGMQNCGADSTADINFAMTSTTDGNWTFDFNVGTFDANFEIGDVLFSAKDQAGNWGTWESATDANLLLYSVGIPDGLDGNSTNWQDINDFTAINLFTISPTTDYGKILFYGTLNMATASKAKTLMTIGNYLSITQQASGDINISVNTAISSDINLTAQITQYHLPHSTQPGIKMDGDRNCDASICTGYAYDTDTGQFDINVLHFSDYISDQTSPTVTNTTNASQ
ncbi:MAG: hypothetical protein ABIA76_03020, partial [Candidatus Diapherotrites archaeon]